MQMRTENRPRKWRERSKLWAGASGGIDAFPRAAPGESVLEDALREMRCMVVLWSESSVKSPWVTEEAEEARRLGKTIVPVLIQRVEPPIGFRAIQAADLTKWDGTPTIPPRRYSSPILNRC